MKTNSFFRLWAHPIWIAVISITGLITALVGDGFWDVLSWIALVIPIILIVKFYGFPTPKK